jgi:hypothetical protein
MNSTHKSFPRKLALLGLLLTPNILVSQSPLAQDVRAKINDDIREKVAGGWIEHGPYVARTIQASGPGATVTINGNGAFFRDRGDIYRLDWPAGMAIETGDRRVIHVGPYQGGTLRAQIITLLHELAHVVDAIPEDDSSRFGPARSQKNTDIIVRQCKRSVDSLARASAKRVLGASLDY